MSEWTAFDQIAASLAVIAGCAVAATLKAFGFWSWCEWQYRDVKAWLFDKPEDDEAADPSAGVPDGWVYLNCTDTPEPEPFKPAHRPKRTRKKR